LFANAKRGSVMDIKPDECADNSDVQQRDEATAIHDLKGEELVLVAGGIRSFGTVSVDK
jgi:hypothetical protein